MAVITKEELTNAFAAALDCKPKYIQTRLVALNHGSVCGRCCGSGHYSYCPMYGTTCFGCSGSGKAPTKLTKKLLESVKVQVANGELLPYITKLKAAQERNAKVKGASAKVFSLWGAQPTIKADKESGIHWSNQSQRTSEINSFCAPLSDEAHKLITLVKVGEWSKEYRGYVPISEERQTEAVDRIEAILFLIANAETLAPVEVK